MKIDTIALIALLAILGIIYILKRKQFKTHRFLFFYFSMFRTKWGMKLMNKLGKKWVQKLGWPMIITCVIGMLLIIEELIRGMFKLLTGTQEMAVGVVLPIEAKGVFYVPFFYWIIAIAVIMVVHEVAHGIFARAHKTRIKSTGFAFLGAIIPIIPGAFVEVDEKHLAKKSAFAQLSIFAAGPFANIIVGIGFLVLFILFFFPVSNSLQTNDGLAIVEVAENSPAMQSGFLTGEIIKEIGGQAVKTSADFDKAFSSAKDGTVAEIVTDKGTYVSVMTDKLGITVQQHSTLTGTIFDSIFLAKTFIWLTGLISWLFILNLGIGLFNLVPLGPIDGGRMLHTILEQVVPKKHAKKIWSIVSIAMLAIITSTIMYAFVV